MMMFLIWIGMVVATGVIADQKNLSVAGYVILAIFLAPIALLIVLLSSPRETETKKKSEGVSLEAAMTQLSYVKSTLEALNNRVDSVERYLNKLKAEEQETSQEVENTEVTEVVEQGPEKKMVEQDVRKEQLPPKVSNAETNFGKYWLNKIGIIVFALGIGFLISYTFKYFGPFIKIAFGYLISGGLFYFGFQLEKKEKFANYGRALLGGAWALTYFTTYAMYHFEASRIIQSQVVDLGLLVVVIVGMIKHALHYKSEGMVALALSVAYLTSIIGQITVFTFVSNILLSLVILILVYQFRWIKTLLLGMILTFTIHYHWVMPEILHFSNDLQLFGLAPFKSRHLMNLAFLVGYWLVFGVGLHLLKAGDDKKLKETIAAANLGNFALFSFISYPLLEKAFVNYQFSVVFIVGVIYLFAALLMKKMKEEKLFLSNIVIAVMAITLSVPLKFSDKTTLLIWLAEIPFLLLVGFNFKQKVYRVLSYGLCMMSFGQLVISLSLRNDISGWADNIAFYGISISFNEFLLLCASFSKGICCYIGRRCRRDFSIKGVDEFFNHAFSLFGFGYLSHFIFSAIGEQWITFVFIVFALVLFGAGNIYKMKRFRVYAYILLAVTSFRFMFVDDYKFPTLFQWMVICLETIIFFIIYFSIKFMKQAKTIDLLYEKEGYFSFFWGVILVVVAIFKYVNWQWISLGLGIAGLILIITGFLSKDKPCRLSGLIIFALTIGRIVFVDLAHLEVIFKIISFIVLGLIFLGISYVYNKFNIGQDRVDQE